VASPVGFLPGQSGNPSGRPRTTGLLNALKKTVSQVVEDGRSVEQHLVDALIKEAFDGKNRMAALSYIFDRLEGRPRQQLDVKDITADLAARTDEELRFFLAHGCWPDTDQAEETTGSM
jgi:hypothetical protein